MQTDGLIIDFRTNFGGNMFLSDSALKILFNYSSSTIEFGHRCSAADHQQMCAENLWNTYKINGAPPGYNKPIALLTGPGAASSGDQVALRMRYHPRVKVFGKSTGAAFNSPVTLNLNADWLSSYSPKDAFELNNPGIYLTHLEFPVDQSVWLTPSLVAQGRDDVVESALSWINVFSGAGTTLLTDNAEAGFTKWVTDEGWGVVKSNAHSPVNSFSDSPKGNYKNNANNSMTLKNPVNASGSAALILSFWQKYAVQSDKDFCIVEVSGNNGTTWQQAVKYTGTVSTIHQSQIDITRYANFSPNVKVRFRLTSDGSTIADGWYVDDILITGYAPGQSIAGINENNIPYNYSLSQNFPNPFNPTTTIKFSLPENAFTKLVIYDALGKEVATLVNEQLSPGSYERDWDAANFPSGVYYYKLSAGNYSMINKMILLK
ncbi:MAG TPA: S41 family peptidase [Ignavibacteria bacterium]|nr:S41 family peptidase [Ignavibacteria bacterium]HMR41365.1 S41 family peptidase [Ignavibacteria bacterium]